MKFKTTPFKHQQRAIDFLKGKDSAALFMEMGTGKTKVVIDDAGRLFYDGKLDKVLVFCPNSIKSTWIEEVETHSPVLYDSCVYHSKNKKLTEKFIAKKFDSLKYLIVGIESMSAGKGHEIIERFIDDPDRIMVVVDESSTIKNYKAVRTKRIVSMVMKLNKDKTFDRYVKYRRIMSGTPMAKGLEDLFMQYWFLSPSIIDMKSFFAFRNRFCTMGGWQMKQVVGYRNHDELMKKVNPFTFRATKKEALDLPPKIYEKRLVELSPEQKKLYTTMRTNLLAVLKDEVTTVTTAVTKILRLRQICGGHIGMPYEDELGRSKYRDLVIPGTNPKLNEVLQILEETDQKAIIWCVYQSEIEMIYNELTKKGINTVYAYGKNKEDENTEARRRFQTDEDVRVYIGQPEGGGIGITLTAATLVIYFSNSSSSIARQQSEDRAHRHGQKGDKVTYIDILMHKTIDIKIIASLKQKKDFSSAVLQAIDKGGWDELL